MWEPTSLKGRLVLIVEDEYLIALDLATEIEAKGGRVLGPAANPDDALTLIEEAPNRPDLAILDVNLCGETVFGVADRLTELNIPFVLVTGYECGSMPSRFENVICFNKPADEHAIVDALTAFSSRQSFAADDAG